MAAIRIPKEFLGAFRAGHRLASREFIDEEFSRDLLNKVMRGCEQSRELLAYLTKFNNEYHKNVLKKEDPEGQLHKGDMRRACYKAENDRNADVYFRTNLCRADSDYQLEILINTELAGNGEDLRTKGGRTPKRTARY